MEGFEAHYDEAEDILYLSREGHEAEVVEVSPGVNMELDADGNLIGVEVFGASKVFKDILLPMGKKLQAA